MRIDESTCPGGRLWICLSGFESLSGNHFSLSVVGSLVMSSSVSEVLELIELAQALLRHGELSSSTDTLTEVLGKIQGKLLSLAQNVDADKMGGMDIVRLPTLQTGDPGRPASAVPLKTITTGLPAELVDEFRAECKRRGWPLAAGYRTALTMLLETLKAQQLEAPPGEDPQREVSGNGRTSPATSGTVGE